MRRTALLLLTLHPEEALTLKATLPETQREVRQRLAGSAKERDTPCNTII